MLNRINKVALLGLIIFATLINTRAFTQEINGDSTLLTLEELSNLDAFPKNSLTAHTHIADEWMVGYEYMLMYMNGNRDGTRSVSNQEVLEDFPITPTKMTKQAHMLLLMYAPTDYLTFMGMFPYKSLSMDHVNRNGLKFKTKSDGIGDIQLNSLYTFFGNVRRDTHRFILDLGISFPTGSINQRDDTPAGPNQKLPYPMQLGSGTFDLIPGIIYIGQTNKFQWGSRINGVIRLGENSNDYRLGNQLHLTSWGNYKINDWISPFVKLDAQFWGNIHGADPELDPDLVPTADPDRSGGKRIDGFIGINFYIPRGFLEGQSIGIEAGIPIFQSLDGPQLETDFQLSIALTWTWIF